MSDKFGFEPRKSPAAALDARVTALEVTSADHETRISALEAGSVASPQTAGAALAIGRSVYRGPSPGKMLAENASFTALGEAFMGFTTSAAAADGDPVNVAGNGQRASGLTGITIGEGYYVSNGVLIPETDIETFKTGASSGVWFRFVGTGFSSTAIDQNWGEPQQVP